MQQKDGQGALRPNETNLVPGTNQPQKELITLLRTQTKKTSSVHDIRSQPTSKFFVVKFIRVKYFHTFSVSENIFTTQIK